MDENWLMYLRVMWWLTVIWTAPTAIVEVLPPDDEHAGHAH